MWTIIKIDKKRISSLKEDLKNKLGTGYTNLMTVEYLVECDKGHPDKMWQV